MATLQHRLVIPAPDSAFAPGDADPLEDTDFYITSKRRVDHPWIAQVGDGEDGRPDITGDGQRLDPATGRVVDGEYQIRVIDVPAPFEIVACDVDDVLVDEGHAHLDDGTAFTTGGWTITENVTGLTAPGWFGINGFGEVDVSGFILFGSGTWEGWIEKTFDGTEGGGDAWTPGQRVAVHARVSWGLDTGPGNLFLETEGGVDPEDGETVHRVSFPDGSYSFWTIPDGLAPNVYDTVASAIADGSGQVIVRIGGEGYGGSCNLNATFSDLEFVSCANVLDEVNGPRYVTGWLADSDARQQLLGRRAYLEESLDEGTTWTSVLYAGYVKRISLDQSLTYVFTLGDAGRGRRVARAWKALNPVEDFIP